MLMKEKITRETHIFPLSPQKSRQRCADHENGLVSFPYEAGVPAVVENVILANKKQLHKS